MRSPCTSSTRLDAKPPMSALRTAAGSTPRPARQRERLRHARDGGAEHDLVAGLRDLPRPRCADVRDALRVPHRGQDRAHVLQHLGVAAHHDRQRPVDGADLAAADGRVEHRAAPAPCTPRPGAAPPAGAIVLMSITTVPGRMAPNTAPSSTCTTSGVSGSIVITTSDWAATSAAPGGRGRALRHQLVHRAAAAAVNDDLEPLLHQVEGHGLAHQSQAR